MLVYVTGHTNRDVNTDHYFDLTLSPPHWLDNMKFDHEDDGSYNDGRQTGLGNVVEIGGEEQQPAYDEEPRVDPAHGGTHATGVVHSPSTQGPRHRHGRDEGRADITQTNGDHLLSSIYCFAIGWK